mgnify:FL=1|tara:strand:+ start:21 stop:221 length:201 start_codon:yes stop_codon:yes gene_type:complete
MADKQATPDAVVTIRASETQRCVAVGAFGRSFETLGEDASSPRGIKAVWRNEKGPSTSAHTKTVSA